MFVKGSTTLCMNESKTCYCTEKKCKSLFVYFPSGPAYVNDLLIKANSTGSLSFRWSPPEGDFDGYDIFLYSSDEVLHDRKNADAKTQECSFQNLRPGALYKMVVLTRSGDQKNDTFIWARTGKGWFCYL